MILYRIKEWLWCALCFVYAPFRGRAKYGAPPTRVVIIQMAKLGDMVCATPLFHALKQHYPSAHITVVGTVLNAQLMAHNKDVDAYYAFKTMPALVRAIREGRYDFACLLGPSTPLLAALFLGGVPCIAAPTIKNGTSPYETLPYHALLSLVVRTPHRMEHYAPGEYLRLLKAVGIAADDTTKHLDFDGEDERAMEHVLKNMGIKKSDVLVGISPSSGNKIKHWPPERFAAVADTLIEKYGVTILLLGTARDAKEIDAVLRLVRHSVVNAEGRFTLGALKALMPRLALLVAVDTGPIYIAEAFGTPTVDIVGPMDEREQPPRGERHLVVIPPYPRVPQLHIMNTRNYDANEARRQSLAISPEMVCDACDTLLQRIFIPKH